MKQVLIRSLTLLTEGYYLTRNSFKKTAPEALLSLSFNGTDKHTFIKSNKPYLKDFIKRRGFPDVFVAYWLFNNGKAIVYIISENESVNNWYKYFKNYKI